MRWSSFPERAALSSFLTIFPSSLSPTLAAPNHQTIMDKETSENTQHKQHELRANPSLSGREAGLKASPVCRGQEFIRLQD